MFSKKKRRPDYINPRRSSLQVNLSYTSNLSESSETEPSQGSLDKNVKRLREAILNKTREIFDNQNDFCKKTAEILGHESISSDQNDQNESNSQEKRNETNRKASTPKLALSPIISSSQNCNSFSSQKLSAKNDETLIGDPLKSSSFAVDSGVRISETPRTSRPVVKSIKPCYVPLDRIDGFRQSRNLSTVSMEMTPVQSNVVMTRSKRPSESSDSGTSLKVRTSIDSDLNSMKDNSRLIHPALSGNQSYTRNPSMSQSHSRGKGGNEEKRMSSSLDARRNSSIVESTPLTVIRSIMLKTMRQSRVTESHRNHEDDDEEAGGETTNVDPGPSSSFRKCGDPVASSSASPLKRVIIEDSSDDGMSDAEPKNIPSSHTVIENSSDLSNDEMSESDDKKQVAKSQPRRRKLFSQLNNSGLINLSPLVNEPSPKLKTPMKRVRRRPKKILKITDKNDKVEKRIITQNPRMTQSRVKFQEILKTEEKKQPKKRKVLSKKIVVKKKMNPDVLRILNELEEEAVDNSEQGRESLNDFTDNKRVATKSRHHNKTIYIVTTGLCNGDKDLIKDAVKKINGAKIETTVSRQTTHVITTGVRTINLLRGIIRGCWLVSLTWVKKSIEARTWLNPEKYEIQHFSKAVKENRRDREIFGRSYVPELFATCGLIYIDHPTSPPREILKELIKTAGGRIIENSQKAKIVIGPNGLKEIWVLDSITTGELQPMDQY